MLSSKVRNCELPPEGVPDSRLLVTRERRLRMEHVLFEPVELTGSDLDAVAGGNPFSVNNVFGPDVVAQSDFAIGAVAGDAGAIAQLGNIGRLLSPGGS